VKRTATPLILILIISTLFWTGAFFIKRLYLERQASQVTALRRIASHPRSEYKIPNTLFTQLLGITQQTSLHTLNCQTLTERLLATSVFETVHLSKALPSTLYISYSMKKPVAKLTANENIGIDAHGNLFPLHPFYPPLRLPSLIISPSTAEQELFTGLEILSLLTPICKKNSLHLSTIDLSRSTHTSFFRRETVVTLLSTQNEPIYLRLNTKKTTKIPAMLSKLLAHLNTTKSGTIDLRFEKIALVSEEFL
jgi:hypothetical protein